MEKSQRKSWGLVGKRQGGICLFFLLLFVGTLQAQEEAPLRPQRLRSELASLLGARSDRARTRARQWARAQGVPLYHQLQDGRGMLLVDVQGNRPIYFMTMNHDAAIASGAAVLYETLDYDLNGAGFTVGLWDQNMPLETHQEFQSPEPRVFAQEPMAYDEHATNVAGTIGAVGVIEAAMGMAPGVRIDAYNWDNDLSEMASAAAAYANEPDMLYVSNHSYGVAAGWSYTDVSGSSGWHWMSEWEGANSVEPVFGQYTDRASAVDAVVWNAQYFLPFVAAGNDRNDNPNQGANIYYPVEIGGELIWRKKRIDAQSPPGDGRAEDGYDTVNGTACAKNVIAVGAVTHAIHRGVRNVGIAEVSEYSAFGPADDGRVKPDLMAQGDSMHTTSASTDRAYKRVSGTSMSCPSASGSAILLVEYHARLFEGQAMRASTLKGLLLHTADDLGRPGPDYQTGWGLINAEAAAEMITLHAQSDAEERMLVESRLDRLETLQTFRVTLDQPNGVTFTLCWTDPDAWPTRRHDSRTPVLVHDLDLRVRRGNQTFLPYTLDPLNPEQNAEPGDNVVDNVEQIVLKNAEPGDYTIEVRRKRPLSTPEQWYSLICDVPVFKNHKFPSR